MSQQITSGDQLTTGQWMSTDAPLISANGLYAAYLQDDANLVLCQTTNRAADLSRPYWSVFANAGGQATGPHAGPHYFAVMQSDGNFVLYNGPSPGSQGPPYWASNTAHPQPTAAVATIRDDGTFAVLPGSDVTTTQTPLYANAVVTDPQALVVRIISGADQTLTVWDVQTPMPFLQPLTIQVTYQNYLAVPGVQVTFGLGGRAEEMGLYFNPESLPDFYQTTTDAHGLASCPMWGNCWAVTSGGVATINIDIYEADGRTLRAGTTVQQTVMGPPVPTAGATLFSLRAHANGKIVTADNAGASPLIANRTAIGPWETFVMITNVSGVNLDGSVSFLALRRRQDRDRGQRRSRAADRQPHRDRPVGEVRPHQQRRRQRQLPRARQRQDRDRGQRRSLAADRQPHRHRPVGGVRPDPGLTAAATRDTEARSDRWASLPRAHP